MSYIKRQIDDDYDEAIHYLNYGIKEGYFDSDMVEAMVEQYDKVGLILKVKELMDRGDAYADSVRKGE